MNKKVVLLGILLLVGTSFLIARVLFTKAPEPVIEQQAEMTIEIADTDAARTQGLSGRTEVPDNYGMLFVFDTPDSYGFWMKDMFVSIDIIWLRDDGTIVGIEDSVSPDTYPQAFNSPEPVRYVLETRAGYARDHGWTIGTKVPVVLP